MRTLFVGVSRGVLIFFLGTLLENSKSSHYYFGNCRYHAKYPPEKRILSDSVRDMNFVDDEDRVTVRAKKAKETGFTGLSALHRLNKLYGFNVLENMVFDAMHNVPLNVVSQHLHYYAEKSLLPKDKVELRLDHVPWTAG